ncbi:MAG TPA: quinone oxidoreductase [Burkholderiales bacterium]
MSLQMRIRQPGGVEQLEAVEFTLPAPGPGEIALRQSAIGVNFVDIYHRTGLYAMPPARVPGVEGVGVVVAAGAGVTNVKPGDRVAYAGAIGAYATERLLPAWRAVAVPAGMRDEVAATALARGLTAHMLMNRVYPVAAGSTLLIHAAAGGLGQLLTQWARARGVTVIATVGSEAKAQIARAAGARHVVVGRNADFAAVVKEVTGGRGVDLAIDGIGGATLAKNFASVRPFGVVASIGQAGGPIAPLKVEDMGAATLTRPSVMAYMNERATYEAAAPEVLAATAAGLAPLLGRGYRLTEAGGAQKALEEGTTTGCLYLLP